MLIVDEFKSLRYSRTFYGGSLVLGLKHDLDQSVTPRSHVHPLFTSIEGYLEETTLHVLAS